MSALAIMAQAIRRVGSSSGIPSSRAISGVMNGRVITKLFSDATARSMPRSSVSAAASTSLCGTDARRMMSAMSDTEPVSQPDVGKRPPSL